MSGKDVCLVFGTAAVCWMFGYYWTKRQTGIFYVYIITSCTYIRNAFDIFPFFRVRKKGEVEGGRSGLSYTSKQY